MNLRKRLSLGQRIRRDKITDMRELDELVALEQRQWGPRMRTVASLGEPMAGLGFTGVAVPNNEVVVAPASVSSQAEVSIYGALGMATTGQNTYMYIPPGNFRAPQSWRVWAGGTFSTAATTSTLTWTTRIGTSTASTGNTMASIGATGGMAGSTTAGATLVTAAPFWYEAHLGIRTPGATGTAYGAFGVEMPVNAPTLNTITGIAAGSVVLDTTQGALWYIGITSSASATTGAQLQHMTIVAWD